MATQGLCYVTSRAKDSSQLADAKFNEFYDDEHVPDMLRYNFSKLALRYKNTEPDSRAAYLALYPLGDIATLSSPETSKMMEECQHSRILGDNHHSLIDYGIGVWTKLQTYEGYNRNVSASHQGRARTLVAVFIEPGEGAEAEADLDAWYRKQHLDMLSMCRGYRRSTRYRRAGDEAPRFLALHEFDCTPKELPADQIQQVRETAWSRDVLGKAKVFDRYVWRLIGEQGATEMQL